VQVHGYIREVRCADTHVRDLKNKPNWQYSPARLKEHAVLFTAPADTDTPTIVAIGMFDLAGGEHERLWCLCISEEEGLLLGKYGDNFQRLGVFLVEAAAWFREVEAKDVTIV
jgi:hypothetical protein